MKTLVIIPHFNKLILLKECLYHLEQQNYNNFDILIVDNGSTDGSSEYIYNLSKDSKYKHILLDDNMGFAYAVNRGIEYSIKYKYDYSILLNNDAYVDTNFVKNLTYSIFNRNNVFAVSSLMINYHNKDIVDSFGDGYSILGWSMQGHVGEDVESLNSKEACFSACAGAAIYNNDVFKEIGLFDENFFAYLEDVDISYRAKLHGYKIYACKDAFCYHLGSATSGTKYNEFKVRISAQNNIYLIYKNMPTIQIAINIIPIALGTIVKQIFFINKGFGLDYFFGIFDAFKNIKHIERVDFNKVSPFRLFSIEIELVVNLFKYIKNFLIRH